MGADGVRELRRCIDNRIGFIGYGVSGSLSPPASDAGYDPYYKLCIEAGIPVLIFVGTTGLGAGLPGGGGVILDHCHPRHLDWVAAHYPELKIVAARPGWPWQAETIAVLMHKRNIWYELHGWSPKYHTPDLKHEIPRRLKDRIMFGGDYPLFTYERLVKEWRAEGYPEEVLDKMFRRNAVRFAESRLSGLEMDLKLKGKVAIVGGASMGIGHGIARTLAAEGAKVAITARREPALREAAAKLSARPASR